jgi:hypothetical protein
MALPDRIQERSFRRKSEKLPVNPKKKTRTPARIRRCHDVVNGSYELQPEGTI